MNYKLFILGLSFFLALFFYNAIIGYIKRFIKSKRKAQEKMIQNYADKLEKELKDEIDNINTNTDNK